MKQTTKMVTLAVALLAGLNGAAMANGTNMVTQEPVTYSKAPEPVAVAAYQQPAAATAVTVYQPATAPVAVTVYQPVQVVSSSYEGPYISGMIGVAVPGTWKEEYGGDYKMKTGELLNGAIGYCFGATRAEVAVGYQQYDYKTLAEDISFLTIMANGFYEFNTTSNIRPYVMAGAGVAKADVSWAADTESVFAWQLGGGLGFKVTDNTTFDIGYRHFRPEKLSALGGGNVKWESNNILVGIRYQF
ncbi:MAG: porin family protein [Chlorobiaceae bacterium]|nr:porin family protein [Chlorobiaceae bacterium]